MKIHMNTGGLAETNAYLVVDEASRSAAIIDAPGVHHRIATGHGEGAWIRRAIPPAHARPLGSRSDHKVVTDAFPNAKVLIHREDEPKLQQPDSLLFELPYTIESRNADAYFEDGDKIHIGHIVLAAMHTPGHAAGHCVIMLYAPEQKVLFAGDLLMAGAVGRYDFPDGKSSTRLQAIPASRDAPSRFGPGAFRARAFDDHWP